MGSWHVHEVFGEPHPHPLDFKHSSQIDQAAHDREVESYRQSSEADARRRARPFQPAGTQL